MTDEILNLMNKRRKYKNHDVIEYKQINKEIKNKIRTQKMNGWKKIRRN